MRVEVFDEDKQKVVLDIKFWKTPVAVRRQANGKELIDTVCLILRDSMQFARGVARHHPLDDYNKIVGKKVALTKAIRQTPFLFRENMHYQTLTSKHRRKVNRSRIWDVFHQTFGRWN